MSDKETGDSSLADLDAYSTVHSAFGISFGFCTFGFSLASSVLFLARSSPRVGSSGVTNLSPDASINYQTRELNPAYSFDDTTLGRVELTVALAKTS